MDYGLVPGTTPFENAMRQNLKNRGIEVRPDTSISGFLSDLEISPPVVKPAGNLYISSHANDEGMLFIELEPGLPAHKPGKSPQAQYEDLKKVDASGSIKIPSAVIDPRPKDANNQPIPAKFNIRGCRIGSQTKYLQLLKHALGGAVIVTAPCFFNGVNPIPDLGVMEFLSYSFEVHDKQPYKKLADLTTAFKNSSQQYYDGTNVPADCWPEYLPKKDSDVVAVGKIPISMKVIIDPPIDTVKTMSTNMSPKATARLAEFRHNREHLGPFRATYHGGSPPKDATQQLADFKDGLLHNDPDGKFDPSYAYPVHERYGYASFDDFMAGWDWKFVVDGNDLVTDGYRHQYICVIPITDYTNNHLFHNFFPDNAAAGPASVIQLKEDDAHFFASV